MGTAPFPAVHTTARMFLPLCNSWVSRQQPPSRRCWRAPSTLCSLQAAMRQQLCKSEYVQNCLEMFGKEVLTRQDKELVLSLSFDIAAGAMLCLDTLILRWTGSSPCRPLRYDAAAVVTVTVIASVNLSNLYNAELVQHGHCAGACADGS